MNGLAEEQLVSDEGFKIDPSLLVDLANSEFFEEELVEDVPIDDEEDKDELLTPEEQNEIANQNYQLIYHWANYYLKLQVDKSAVMDLDGLVSACQMGFVCALKTYKKNSGIRFTTYASECMKNQIFADLKKERRKIRTVSIDDTGEDENPDHNLLYQVVDESVNVEDEVVASEATGTLLSAINQLNENEKFLICSLFGVGGVPKRTQVQLAQILNVTQANISKSKKVVLKKLRVIMVARFKMLDYDG